MKKESIAKQHEDLILGGAFGTILDYDAFIPSIAESQFRQFVLPLLKDPYNRDNLREYVKIAQELTRPVRVHADGNLKDVLFQIPALTPPPRTGVAAKGGLMAGEFLNSLKRDFELGGRGTPERVTAFMKKITLFPDIVQEVLIPLRAILKRYDEDFIVPEFRGEDGQAQAELVKTETPAAQSSFTDEYDS